jgi:hypothetical protein
MIRDDAGRHGDRYTDLSANRFQITEHDDVVRVDVKLVAIEVI